MLQVRKLVLAVAAATAFTSSFTHALGLGDLSVKSSLNQPLEAEISLLEVRDLTSLEIKTQLASPEEFSKAGVERQFYLTGLKFTPVIDATGKKVIRVTSNKPIKEPYLNFLVEVLWPNGRLLREYTLLLDPPMYKPQQVIYSQQPPAVAAVSRPSATATQPARKPQPIARTAPAPAPVAKAPASTAVSASSALQGTEYRVQKNDTLWEVAQRVAGNGSVHQTMLAIQDLNPNAFLDGNINRMKNGQVLRLPTAQDISARSHAEAIAQVGQQNTRWKDNARPARAERQLDATRRSEAGAAPSAIEKVDSLTLVSDAPGKAQQAADQGSAGELKSLRDKLAVSQERLDSTVLENQDLSGRVEDLNSQLDKLKRLIELKDNQLAQLQNNIDAPVEAAAVESAVEAVEPVSDLEPVVADVTEPIDTSAVADLEQDVDAVTEVDVQSELEPEVVAAPELVIEAEAPAPVVQEPAVQEPVAAQTPQAEEQGIIDQVMDNPMLLAAVGGGAALALLLLLMAVSRSKSRKEAERDAADDELSNASTVKDVPPVIPGSDADVFEEPEFSATDDKSDFADDFNFDEPFDEPVAASPFKQEATDPLVEADSYISFGRFSQAADVLNSAIEREPERIDLRVKLVEVYADLQDQAGFSRQVSELTEIGGASSELASFKARYPHMFTVDQVDSFSLDDDFAGLSLDDITLDTPASVEPKPTSDLEAELDDLSALLADTESSEESSDLDFDLDLDSDFSGLTETTTEAAVEETMADAAPLHAENLAEENDEFDLDSFTFDLETPTETPVESDFASLDEFSLDDLTLDLAKTTDVDLPSFELPEVVESEAEPSLEVDFAAQLDEVSADLETMSASLDDTGFAEAEPLDTDFDEFSLDDLDFASTLESVEPLDSIESVEPAVTAESIDPIVTAGAALELNDLEELGGIDDDFSFLSGTDETATKLDLARAYIDMGDAEGARDILDEVTAEGTAAQQDEARALISQLG